MRILAAGVLLGALSGWAGLGAEEAPAWLSSWDAAVARARAEGRPIACRVESGTGRGSPVYDDPLVATLLQDFVCVRVTSAALPEPIRRLPVDHPPVIVFLTPLGIPKKLIQGELPRDRFAAQIREAYEQIVSPAPRRLVPAPEVRQPLEVSGDRPIAHAPPCPRKCPACRAALARALDFLARRQRPDGGWEKLPDEVTRVTPDGKQAVRALDHIDEVLTALAGLAFLAGDDSAGADPGGARRKAVGGARDSLLRCVRPDGLISHETGDDFLFQTHANFQTPLAAAFLAELHARKPDPVLQEKLDRVARYLARSQDPATGGWGYSADWKDYPRTIQRGWTLLATTQCMVAALAALRDAGIAVDAEAIRKGAAYVAACRMDGGAYGYGASPAWGWGHPGATGGALYALARAEDARGTAWDESWAWFRRRFRGLRGAGEHLWFSLFFSGLAMNAIGEGAGAAFDDDIRDFLLRTQREDGSWEDPDARGGRVYATAVAAVLLQLPGGRLPVAMGRRLAVGAAPGPPKPQAGEGGSSRELKQSGPEAPPTSVAKAPPTAGPAVRNPSPTSRVKMFEVADGYRFDCVVSVEADADRPALERLREGLARADRILFDATDGQVCLRRAEIQSGRRRWDEADIQVTRDFHNDPALPVPWAHGCTLVSANREVADGVERRLGRVGEYVRLPYFAKRTDRPVDWGTPAGARAIAHELGHYLFGLTDEYDRATGASFCDCLMGSGRATELCGRKAHATGGDPSCRAQARALYPRLREPAVATPGPWDPPEPEIVIR